VPDDSIAPVHRGPRRWREQRWLVDEAIRNNGIEWDQRRLGYTLGPVGGDSAAGDMLLIRTRVKKVADFVPVVGSVAARRERQAREAQDAGHPVSAAEHWFAAALLWSLAVWPLWEPSAQLLEFDRRKNEAYLAWTRLAAHRVERVEIPFQDGYLPAWFHLPATFDGVPVPTALVCGGMDAPREVCVARTGDALLARGFAVLAFDGPGQGESAIHGIHVTSTNWIDAGEQVVSWARNRPEVDAQRLVCSGASFGSFWISQIAATQPSLLGCAAALPVFEPGGATIFEQACPTFKARHMFMAGLYDDEDSFDRLVTGYDLRPLIDGMRVPWLVVAGEADDLSPVDWVYEMVRRCPAPSSLLVYQGCRHSLSESLAPVLGPPWRNTIADWLLDRAQGVPATDDFRYVTGGGDVLSRPHPRSADGAATPE
jgi:fermentation-respiration switch protein FrsA (DUF1100 family)